MAVAAAALTAQTAERVPFPQLDPNRNQIVLCIGRKGSGKSVAARTLYRDWPGVDKLTIDVNGDAEPGEDAQHISPPFPNAMPDRGDDGEPLNLWYVANPASPEYRDDLDRAIGLALFPRDRRTLLWVDEIGEVTQANKTPPHLRRLLQQSRHFKASALLCGPRPMNIDPLCINQADRVLIFDLPNPADRQRVAENIGFPPKTIDEAVEGLRTRAPFSYLMYVAQDHRLYACPPLPAA